MHKYPLFHKFLTFISVLFKGQLFYVLKVKSLRKKWDDAKIKKMEYVVSSVNGVKLFLHTDSKLCEIIVKESFESAEQLFLKHYLRRKDVFFDVGANIGLYSILARKFVGTKGVVHSFEPTLEIYNRLSRNILLNKYRNVFSHNIALSNTCGYLDFNISHDGYDAWNSLGYPSAGNVITKTTVWADTLDNLIQEYQINKVDLIKIDVEGWEIQVLQGGSKYFSKPDSAALLVEFTDQNLNNAGFTAHSLYHLIVSYGYKLYSYDIQKRYLVQEQLRTIYPYVNLIALKPVHFDRIEIKV